MCYIWLFTKQDNPRVAQTIGLVNVPSKIKELNQVEDLHQHICLEVEYLQDDGVWDSVADCVWQVIVVVGFHMETHITDQ